MATNYTEPTLGKNLIDRFYVEESTKEYLRKIIKLRDLFSIQIVHNYQELHLNILGVDLFCKTNFMKDDEILFVICKCIKEVAKGEIPTASTGHELVDFITLVENNAELLNQGTIPHRGAYISVNPPTRLGMVNTIHIDKRTGISTKAKWINEDYRMKKFGKGRFKK